jgi:DNA (cytosine-5)-methyltransferase 1
VSGLVLSLFPGVGLLDRAFEQEGFCVVRGPDLLWGGDVRHFHPPAGRFDGVIGGPPCKGESNLAHLNGTPGQTMRDEFYRVVGEAAPAWWVCEAVKRHDAPFVLKLNNRWLGQEQRRVRYFHSNLDLRPGLVCEPLIPAKWKHAVLAGHGGAEGTVMNGMAKYSLPEACRLQGLPDDFADRLPFTRDMKYEVIGNGVPLPMGRAIARAVRQAVGPPSLLTVCDSDPEPHRAENCCSFRTQPAPFQEHA